MKSFGGKWTEQKLEAFIDYVKAYLKIFTKHKRWETIYFDGFAGAAEIIRRGPKKNLLFDFEYGKKALDDLILYKGSVRRVLELPKPYHFDWYYFVDITPKNITEIDKLKSEITQIDPKRIIPRCADCNEQIPKLANTLKKGKHAALIFLDPFGMQAEWETIAKLKNTRSDIWLLIPSGVAINRLLPRTGQIKHEKKLESFFGLPITEIYDFFYSEREKHTLLGTEIQIDKISKPVEGIVELYKRQLLTIWKHVSNPLILKNSRNTSIYHFLFASNNPVAVKIALQIIEKKQR